MIDLERVDARCECLHEFIRSLPARDRWLVLFRVVGLLVQRSRSRAPLGAMWQRRRALSAHRERSFAKPRDRGLGW
jgi:hypothetical protein